MAFTPLYPQKNSSPTPSAGGANPSGFTPLGQTPSTQAPAPVTPASYEAQPAYQTAFGDQLNTRADTVGQDLNSNQPLYAKALGVFGQGVGAVSDAVNDVGGEAIGAVAKTANNLTGGIGGALADKAVQAVMKTPLGVQGVNAIAQGSDSWAQFEQKHPTLAMSLSALPPLANLITQFYTAGEGAVAAKTAGEAVAPALGDALKTGAAKVADKTSAVVSSAKKAVGAETTALERVTPSYEGASIPAKQKLQGETVGGAPRINEGGFIKGRTINSTPLEKEAAAELEKVPGYSNKLTHLQTENLIRPEIAARGRALTASLAKENVLVPKKQIVNIVRGALSEVPESSLLLQKSDPAIKNYIRVTANAAASNDGTLKGVLNVRKALDAAYSHARGKLAYDSDKLSALDEVHTAGRDALTQYLIDNAKNTDVKAALRGQWNLYRALDVIAPKAAREEGSAIHRVIGAVKKHPVVAGIGALEIAKHTIAPGLPGF